MNARRWGAVALLAAMALATGCVYVPSQQTFDSPLVSPAEQQIPIVPQIVFSAEPPSRGVPLARFSDATEGGEPAASLEDAQSRLAFPLLVPAALPEGFDLVRIATGMADSLLLLYSDGEHYLPIIQTPSTGYNIPDENTPLNPWDEYFVVNDYPATGHDLGIRLMPWIGPSLVVSPEYADLTWWPKGLVVFMRPQDATVTLADLTMMAESMQPLPTD